MIRIATRTIAESANVDDVVVDSDEATVMAARDQVLDLRDAPPFRAIVHNVMLVEEADCAREPEFPAEAITKDCIVASTRKWIVPACKCLVRGRCLCR